MLLALPSRWNWELPVVPLLTLIVLALVPRAPERAITRLPLPTVTSRAKVLLPFERVSVRGPAFVSAPLPPRAPRTVNVAPESTVKVPPPAPTVTPRVDEKV